MRSDPSKWRRLRRSDQSVSLPDDILVDILSRLPVKSLFRCKVVSRRWGAVISREDHRRKLARTRPGLFYDTHYSKRFPATARNFTHVWEGNRSPLISPSLSFLPAYCQDVTVLDCCNGILLCRFSQSRLHDGFRYVVCNPVEESMTILPDTTGCSGNMLVARLAFDPAFSPVTYVFEFLGDEVNNDLVGANIYSSETGAWDYKKSGWSPDVPIPSDVRCVFFNGFLHLLSCLDDVLVVDVEGDKWRMIGLPAVGAYFGRPTVPGFIGIYKEHLCYINKMEGTHDDLAIWILEDYTKDDWVIKHQLSIDKLREHKNSPYTCSDCYEMGSYHDCYNLIGIFQDCNSILDVTHRALMAYDR